MGYTSTGNPPKRGILYFVIEFYPKVGTSPSLKEIVKNVITIALKHTYTKIQKALEMISVDHVPRYQGYVLRTSATAHF